MSYSRDVIISAKAELARRKSAAESAQQLRHSEITAKIPEISSVEHELAATGLSVVKAIGMGENAEKYVRELSKINLSLQKRIKELLRANGYPENYLETDYVCKKCDDTGYVCGEPCSCRALLLRELAMKKLCGNSQAAKCSFSNFRLDYYPDTVDEQLGISPRKQMQVVFDYCRGYAEDFDLSSGSLYLYGATGLGKTHLTLAIAGAVAISGYNVIYDSAQNLLNRLEKEHFSSSNDHSHDGALDELINCDLLIIDDLGSEFSTQFTVSAIYNVLNTRLNCSKPVIISTNLDTASLEAKYDQRITSRILGGCTPLFFVGNDVRQIKSNL